MKRREFFGILAGTAASLLTGAAPAAAPAAEQQGHEYELRRSTCERNSVDRCRAVYNVCNYRGFGDSRPNLLRDMVI